MENKGVFFLKVVFSCKSTIHRHKNPFPGSKTNISPFPAVLTPTLESVEFLLFPLKVHFPVYPHSTDHLECSRLSKHPAGLHITSTHR